MNVNVFVSRTCDVIFVMDHVVRFTSPSNLCLCILQAIKNWSRGRPGNEANPWWIKHSSEFQMLVITLKHCATLFWAEVVYRMRHHCTCLTKSAPTVKISANRLTTHIKLKRSLFNSAGKSNHFTNQEYRAFFELDSSDDLTCRTPLGYYFSDVAASFFQTYSPTER